MARPSINAEDENHIKDNPTLQISWENLKVKKQNVWRDLIRILQSCSCGANYSGQKHQKCFYWCTRSAEKGKVVIIQIQQNHKRVVLLRRRNPCQEKTNNERKALARIYGRRWNSKLPRIARVPSRSYFGGFRANTECGIGRCQRHSLSRWAVAPMSESAQMSQFGTSGLKDAPPTLIYFPRRKA